RHTRCLSDWSSDVCSSDLDRSQLLELTIDRDAVATHLGDRAYATTLLGVWSALWEVAPFAFRVLDEITAYIDEAESLDVPWELRSEERRVGKECRCRWARK